MLDAYKELMPVVYGEKAIKLLYTNTDVKISGKICFSMHWHDRMEILYVLSGSLEIHTEEGHDTVLPGQVAVFEPRQLHGGFSGSEGVVYYTIMFDVEKFCNGTMASEKYLVPICENKVSFQRVIDDERLSKTMDKLVETLKSREENASLLAIGALYESIGILYQYRDKTARIIHKPDKGFGDILEYVNEHYGEKISTKDISDKFGYNETYFSRRFKEITGLTFSKYIQALRMERAQKLLRSTKDEIGVIAWKCGYTDISYFSNCFKKNFGYNPTEFRGKTED